MDDRKQKLAQALRENLMRRKRQARARSDASEADPAAGETDPAAEADGRKKATLPENPDAASG